jgi:hypothetical protein
MTAFGYMQNFSDYVDLEFFVFVFHQKLAHGTKHCQLKKKEKKRAVF